MLVNSSRKTLLNLAAVHSTAAEHDSFKDSKGHRVSCLLNALAGQTFLSASEIEKPESLETPTHIQGNLEVFQRHLRAWEGRDSEGRDDHWEFGK